MKSNSKLPIIKRRGRPLGSKNKRKTVAKKVAAKDRSFKRVDGDQLLEKILTNDMIAEQERKILNLEHQVVGYKAVISYLEHQLGKTK